MAGDAPISKFRPVTHGEVDGQYILPLVDPSRNINFKMTLAELSAFTVSGGGIVPDSREIIAGVGLGGGGPLTDDIEIYLADTAVVAGNYGSSTLVPRITIDAQGRLTSVVEQPIAFPSTVPIGPAGGDLAGTYPNPQIAPGAIDPSHIQSGAITEFKIADGAVSTTKLADNAVTNVKMADNAVNTAEIVNGAVTAPKLAPNIIDTPIIVDGAVTTAKLADNAVTQIKMADNAVGTAEIINLNVTTAKLADGAVTAPKLAPGVIDTPILVDNAVTNPKLADMAQATVKGRAAGVGTGDPQDLTQAQLVGVLDTSNVTLTKPLIINIPGAGDALYISSSATGSAEGPSIAFTRDMTPTVALPLTVLRWYSKNTSNVGVEYSNLYSYLTDSSAGGETAEVRITSRASGGYHTPFRGRDGMCVGYPSGDFRGEGTINAGAYYVNGTLIASGSNLTTAAIPDNSITSSKIQNNTIVYDDLANPSVGWDKFYDQSIPTRAFASRQILGWHIAAEAITNYEIADGTIRIYEIGPDAVDNWRLTDVGAGTVKCRPFGWGTSDPVDVMIYDFLHQMANNTGGQAEWYHRPIWHAIDGAGIGEPGGGYGQIQLQSVGGGSSAMVCFHRVGSHASYFGLNGDNTLRQGGWSYGAAAYPVFNQAWVAGTADMKARSATYVPVTPAYMIYHGGVSKTWCLVNNSGGFGESHNCSGVDDSRGEGNMGIGFGNAVESQYPSSQVTVQDSNYNSTTVIQDEYGHAMYARNYNIGWSAYADPLQHWMFTMHGIYPG